MSPFKMLWDALGRLANSQARLADRTRSSAVHADNVAQAERIGDVPMMIERVTEFSRSIESRTV